MIETKMNQLIRKTREYLNYIEEHYHNVQKAWKIIQEKCRGKDFPFLYDDHKFFILDNEIKNHDISKLSHEELVPYRQNFFPIDLEAVSRDSFNEAWEHHKKHNPHHWQTWTQEDSAADELNLIHNICDWMAMSMKFEGDAREYYNKNKEEINMPEWAEKYMFEIFDLVYGAN